MKIMLSKFQNNDFTDYFSLVSNEKVMAQITERSTPFEEAQVNYQKLIERNNKYETLGSYKIFDATGKKFIGLGHVTLNEELPDEAEIGYMILPEYWGQGYGTEIAKELTRKARESKLKMLKAIIDPNNIPSRKILINLGFKSEQICMIDGLSGEILYKNL